MEEVKFEFKKVEIGNNSLAIAKGYGYQNKEGKQRYSINDSYFVDGDKYFRKVTNDRGEFFYNVELMDVVMETFLLKDGNRGQKVYPLSEVPYLCDTYETADVNVLMNYLSFKLHR